MVEEETPRKWSVWATHSKRQTRIAELHDTTVEAAARAADLRDAGYNVEITPGKLRAND